MTLRWGLLFVVAAGCASGPRPVPQGLSPTERLQFSEELLVHAKDLGAKFELESKGENEGRFEGTLKLYGENQVFLSADGRFKGEAAQVQLDSRDQDGINRTVTRGPSASSFRDPPAAHVREAMMQSLLRMGLMHNVARLTLDQPVDHAEGGFDDYVKAITVTDGGPDAAHGESCQRVNFALEVGGAMMGDGSVCISDMTGLPIARRTNAHFPQGDMTVTESFTWEAK